jgi:phage-related protein
MSEVYNLRPLLWVASSKRDFDKMPDDVTDDFGHWLYLVQKGKNPKSAKPLSGFGGANVMEFSKDCPDSTFRTVYTAKFEDVIIVLHAFQKKSNKKIETPKQEVELIRSRIKLAEAIYKELKAKRGKK